MVKFIYNNKMPTLNDSVTERLLAEEKKRLEKTKFPIVTLSASYRDVVERGYRLEDGINHPDIVLSRAHYSMALGLAVTAWEGEVAQPKKAWLLDPTNYVQAEDWSRVALSELLGRSFARIPILQFLKRNILDKRRGKQRLPFTDAITGPLLEVTSDVRRPIISVHIEVGKLLAAAGHDVVQIVTDPHARADYLELAKYPSARWAVFDEVTKTDFMELAGKLDITFDADRMVVTGPPIDPRLFGLAKGKKADSWRRRGLRVLLTTGGLGTNGPELLKALEQLLPRTRRRSQPWQICFYAGTNLDLAKKVRQMAYNERIRVGENQEKSAPLRILAGDDIVEANRRLLAHGLAHADLVLTKPSGDMAYDAAAAGCSSLYLTPWGDWEEAIAHRFTTDGLARWADLEDLPGQIDSLLDSGWISETMSKLQTPSPLWLRGTRNMLQIATS